LSRYVLDTSAYSHFNRGEAKVVALLDSAHWVGIPAVVLGELEVGFLLGMPSRLEENRAILAEFLANPVVEELGLDHEVSRIYAEILVDLRQDGAKVPTNDLWIAALVVEHELTLYTRDAHFAHLPQLELLP